MHAPFIYNNVAAAMIHDTVRYCVHDDDISYRVLKNTVYPVHHNNVGYIFDNISRITSTTQQTVLRTRKLQDRVKVEC